MKALIIFLFISFHICLTAQQKTTFDLNDIVRLQFQNPGLQVDLGVGLWPYPLPMDYDGDNDLLANSENAALYENMGEKNGQVIFRNRGNLMKIVLTGHDTSPTIVDWNSISTNC